MFKRIAARIRKCYVGLRLSLSDQRGITDIYRKYYGVRIGDNARFTGTPSWGSEPYLIQIGDNVTITQRVTFHTHDGGVGILRSKYPGINIFGRINVGNNVFIGSDTIILPGVTIGDNVVIGAGSVVTRDIPPSSVAVGVPAKVIKSIQEYEQQALQRAVYVTTEDPDERKKIILRELNK